MRHNNAKVISYLIKHYLASLPAGYLASLLFRALHLRGHSSCNSIEQLEHFTGVVIPPSWLYGYSPSSTSLV